MSNSTTDQREPILKSHRRPDVQTTIVAVGDVRFGDGSYPVIAGPVAVESDAQIQAAAEIVAGAGGSILRAGSFRSPGSPYDYKGLGGDALWLLEKAGRDYGLPTMTEATEVGQLQQIADHVDMIEIGADNMQNFVLVREAGAIGLPVLLHRGASATIDEWLMSAEYILNENNNAVVLCESGIRTFEPRTSNTLDISAIPVVQGITHLPVVINPTPDEGGATLVGPLALAGRTIGADGLIVAVHADPAGAMVGNGRQLDAAAFAKLMDSLGIPLLRDEIDRIDRQLIQLVARRLASSVEIGKIKAARGLPLRAPEREAELLAEARADAAAIGLAPQFIEDLMRVVLDHSVDAQQRAVDEGLQAS